MGGSAKQRPGMQVPAGSRGRAVGLTEMQHVRLETSGQLRGIVHADDALIGPRSLTSCVEGRQLSLRFHAFLAYLHDVDAASKSRPEKAFEIALLFPGVSAQVEPGKAEACLQAHQRSHEATIVVSPAPTR